MLLKTLKNIIKTVFFGLGVMILLLFNTLIAFGTFAFGVFIIILGLSSGVGVLSTILGSVMIYIAFLFSKDLYESIIYLSNSSEIFINNTIEIENHNKDSRENIIEENDLIIKKINELGKEYNKCISMYNPDMENYISSLKIQVNSIRKIQNDLNNLKKIANKKIVFEIEKVWEKVKLNVVDNIIQVLIYMNYMNSKKEIVADVAKRLIEENNFLLESQEVFLNNTLKLITNKTIKEKELEYRSLMMELDAIEKATYNVINMS